MVNKIVYIVKSKLHYYPPCISQIRMIKDLGWDIEVLYGSSNESALEILQGEGIRFKKIGDITDENTSYIEKISNWFSFRFSVSKEMRKYPRNTYFWFGTAESILPMKGALKGKKYIVSLLELLDDNKIKLKLLKNIVKNAEVVTVCEETRAYIMKQWFGLKKIPYIFPNKPYKQIINKMHEPSIKETKCVIETIKEKNIILYQGIIQNTEELIEIASGLKEMKSNYILLLMGIDKYKSVDKIKKIYKNTKYVSYVPAPYHLEITSYAKIGITFYRPDSLNKVFCAPNKIYEYGSFGIPILANNIPGLKNTVGKIGAAECIEINKENVIEAIKKIENDYERYSKNATNFFESTNNVEIMRQLLGSLV
ncbi:MAG: hypothetical protein ACRC30_14025 [Clostridium sp.]